MSHLRPLTVAWSSGGVGVSGGQPQEFAGRGARTSCSDPQHRCPAHTPPQPAAPAAGRRCSEASKQGARGPHVCHGLGCRPLSGPAALSSRCSSVGLWFAISFLRQLEPQQPPARLLKMP